MRAQFVQHTHFSCRLNTPTLLPFPLTYEYTHAGMSNRQAGANNLNEHSTRSHAILTLYVESEVPDRALDAEAGEHIEIKIGCFKPWFASVMRAFVRESIGRFT